MPIGHADWSHKVAGHWEVLLLQGLAPAGWVQSLWRALILFFNPFLNSGLIIYIWLHILSSARLSIHLGLSTFQLYFTETRPYLATLAGPQPLEYNYLLGKILSTDC